MATESKVALVTGSSSGIGAATVRLLSQKGYKVVVTGSRKDKVDKVVAESLELSPHGFQVSLPANEQLLSETKPTLLTQYGHLATWTGSRFP